MTQTGRYLHRRRIALLLIWLSSWTAPAFSQTPAGATRAALRLEQVELVDSGHAKRVTLQFSQPPTALKAFALGSPSRVVIDVQGSPSAFPSATYAAQDSLIQRVRVGFHKEYIRFVLDLKKGTFIPPFSIEQKQATVTASLQVLGQTAARGNRDNRTIPFADATSQVLFSRRSSPAIARALDQPTQTSQAEPVVQATRTPAAAPSPPQPVVQAARTPEPPAPAPSPSPPARASHLFRPEEQAARTRSARVPSAQADNTATAPLLMPGASLIRPSSSSPQRPAQRPYSLLSPAGTARESAARPSAGRTGAARSARSPRQLAAISPRDALRRPSKKTPPAPSLSQEARRHLGKGQILYDQGKLAEAIAEWRETARLAPNHAKARHLLGLALQDQGNTEEAVGELQTSVRLDPDNATAYVHLAQALESKGDSQGALGAYNKALELVPTSAHVHNRLGHLLAAQGDWQGAAKEWQQTTDLQPDYSYAYANLGEALEQIEKKKEALEAYQQAVLLDPAAPFASEVRRRIVRLSTDDL